jgi:hypothetical protein
VRIDYDLIGTGAFTPRETIHLMPSDSFCTDLSACANGNYIPLLVHEAGHVYEFQKGVDPAVGYFLGGSWFHGVGEYLNRSEYVQSRSSPPPLNVFNTERFADWHTWHYMCSTGRVEGC